VLRLLYLNHNVVGTGTYLRALHLGRAMVQRGHEVTLVTTSRDARLGFVAREEDGVRVLEAPDLWTGPARTGWDPWNVAWRVAQVRGHAPDLVHAFDGRPVVSVPAWLLKQLDGVPFVMDWADWWGRGGQIQQRSGWAVRTFFGPVETWFEEAFRPRAAAHTTISQPLRDRAVALGLSPERVLVLRNGCEPGRIRPMAREDARVRVGVPDGVQLAVHLGVMTAADMELMAGAWRRVVARNAGARLVLVGNPRVTVPGDLLAAGAVQVTGFVSDDDKNAWLSAADICVVALPDTVGNRARWPSKVNDYFCAGRPTVMTRVGDAAELIETRALGVVTGPDPEAFADGIVQALDERTAMAEAGARARALAESDFAWPVLAEQAEGLYQTAAGSAQVRGAPRGERRGSIGAGVESRSGY
jgi:glycosyltransferase involved in cell wall biosynthesis